MDAVNVDPSLCAATTVFRPIAPARMNMAASRVSLRDIMYPPRIRKTRRILYPLGDRSQATPSTNLFQIDYVSRVFARLSPGSIRNLHEHPHNRVLAVPGQRYCGTTEIGTLGCHSHYNPATPVRRSRLRKPWIVHAANPAFQPATCLISPSALMLSPTHPASRLAVSYIRNALVSVRLQTDPLRVSAAP